MDRKPAGKVCRGRQVPAVSCHRHRSPAVKVKWIAYALMLLMLLLTLFSVVFAGGWTMSGGKATPRAVVLSTGSTTG